MSNLCQTLATYRICAVPGHDGRCGSGWCVPGSGRGSGCWATVFRFLCYACLFHASLIRDVCWRRTAMVLVELGVVEQRFQAVLEVLGGASVSDVARRYGVVRQTVHRWLRKYAGSGVSGLADQSSRPHSCPHQMLPQVEARVVEMRRAHPGWGSRTILYWLAARYSSTGNPPPERCVQHHTHHPTQPDMGGHLLYAVACAVSMSVMNSTRLSVIDLRT